MYKIKEEYRRYLPHFQPTSELAYFVTTRLAGSLPKTVIEEIHQEHEKEITRITSLKLANEKKALLVDEQNRRYFGKFDQLLDAQNRGPHWFKTSSIAQLAYDSFLHFHEKRYEMICFTIMSNHIQLLFWLNEDKALYGVMHSLKRFIANKANQLLDREGAFWARESYDRVVRNDEELKRIMQYIMMNPVKAGVVENWEAYPWTFVNEKYFSL